jgi:Mg-chelatase subunit ChlD
MRFLVATTLLFGALLAPAGADETAKAPEAAAPRTIELAICLDTSNSMDGLIDAARRKIWTIVNDLALAKPTPRLRVAVLAYGNDNYDKGAGWVKVQATFTEDLDHVSKTLFGLTTRGGTEYVGRVLQSALTLPWQEDKNALKLIIVSGNESAAQDPTVDYRQMCRAAIARGIMVNPIYCTRPENVGDTWKEIARLSDGHYAAIDQNRTVDIASPFDAKLAALSTEINATYVAFGQQGDKGKARQKAADSNAQGLSGGSAADRAQSKAGALYWNSWCLADNFKRGSIKLEDVKQEDLPKELRGKTVDELRVYLDGKLKERETIQTRIKELHTKRQAWIVEELKRQGADGDKSFDVAVRKALRTQAEAKGYEFEK